MNIKVSEVHESKKLNIIKIAMCFRFIYRFNTIPFRIPDDRDSYFTSYTKINSKWINDLTVRVQSTEFLKGSTSVNLHDLRFGNGFLDVTPKAQETKNSKYIQFSSVSQSCLTLCDPMDLQHAQLPCSSPTPRGCSNSCLPSRWCHPTISSSVVPFFSHLQSFPASGSFQVSQVFTSGGLDFIYFLCVKKYYFVNLLTI